MSLAEILNDLVTANHILAHEDHGMMAVLEVR